MADWTAVMTDWIGRLDLRIGLTDWTYRLDLQIGLTDWTYRLDLRIGLTDWTYGLDLRIDSGRLGCSHDMVSSQHPVKSEHA